MAFHEQWFNAKKIERLKLAMGQVSASAGLVVEVGCWEGRSTIQIARFFGDTIVLCIDHWKGDLTDHKSGVAVLAAQRDVFADFTENMQNAAIGNYSVLRKGWREAFPLNEPIKFLFIDGEHTYLEVFDNITLALPDMMPGSVMAGDDYTTPAVARAIEDSIGQVETCEGQGRAVWYKKF